LLFELSARFVEGLLLRNIPCDPDPATHANPRRPPPREHPLDEIMSKLLAILSLFLFYGKCDYKSRP